MAVTISFVSDHCTGTGIECTRSDPKFDSWFWMYDYNRRFDGSGLSSISLCHVCAICRS